MATNLEAWSSTECKFSTASYRSITATDVNSEATKLLNMWSCKPALPQNVLFQDFSLAEATSISLNFFGLK